MKMVWIVSLSLTVTYVASTPEKAQEWLKERAELGERKYEYRPDVGDEERLFIEKNGAMAASYWTIRPMPLDVDRATLLSD